MTSQKDVNNMMFRSLLLIILFCSFSFSQELTFIHQTIGTDLKLDLKEDQTFVLIDAGKGCEGNQFGSSTYRGRYKLVNNLLTLEPQTIFVVKGEVVYENRIRIEKIKSSSLEDFDPTDNYVSLTYEVLEFEDFKILLRLDYPIKSDDYEEPTDQSIFFNYLNSTKEVNKKYNNSFTYLFLTSEEDHAEISLEKMRNSIALKNRKETFKAPVIANITSIKERIEKNENYYPDFDDRKFIRYLDIEIAAGSNDGVYKGMNIHFKNIADCITDNYAMIIDNTKENTATFTYELYEDNKCDLVNYLVGKEVYFKGYWSP